MKFDWCFRFWWESDYKNIEFFFGRFINSYNHGWHFQVRSFQVRPVVWWTADSPRQYVKALADMARCL